jgi:pyridoxine kinase
MALVLVIGSHVAGSRVGGTVASLVLALSPGRIDPMHVPTTLMGRHPGWGPPGGGAVSAQIMQAMLDGIEANRLFALCDAVLTGYCATPDQVEVAARAIAKVKAANPRAIIMVDPVMGDHPAGLYIAEDTARAIHEHLVPRADILTPNAFEVERLMGRPVIRPSDAVRAARALGKTCIVTSLDHDGDIAMALVSGDQAWQVSHARVADVPKGTGDALAALVLASLLQGTALPVAFAQAAGTLRAVIEAARDWAAPELPLIGALGHGGGAVGAAPLPLVAIPD